MTFLHVRAGLMLQMNQDVDVTFKQFLCHVIQRHFAENAQAGHKREIQVH